MQVLKNLFTVLVFGLALTLTACQGGHQQHNDANAAGSESTEATAPATDEKSGPEYTSAYVCPMHCPGSGSAEPGKCPSCGMDYVANENAGGENHEGHNH